MKKFLRYYLWFWKESFYFMKGYSKTRILWGCLTKAPAFAWDMVKWNKATPEQRKAWYASGEGRTLK